MQFGGRDDSEYVNGEEGEGFVSWLSFIEGQNLLPIIARKRGEDTSAGPVRWRSSSVMLAIEGYSFTKG